MSEYQYYGFLAIDRPLTPEEQQAVARLSSRVDPHPWRAVFTYSWSDFPGSAGDVLAQYYDAMLYMASWGSAQLMFRFPKALIDLDRLRQYRVKTLAYPSDAIAVSTVGTYAVLDIQIDDEEGGGWIEGEGWLDALVPLREDILRGDMRTPYLAWLGGVAYEYEVDEDAPEPPVPPGLGDLTPGLRSFVKLFRVDEDLIQAAAERSPKIEPALAGDELHQLIARLAAEEKDAFLLRLAQGEPHLSLAFTRRLQALADVPKGRDSSASRRTVRELLAAAEERRERERQRQAREAEQKRIEELEALARQESKAWAQVDALIAQKKAREYDEAIQLLLKLRDLAAYRGQTIAFQQRLSEIRERYSNRPAWMRRLRETGLSG
jgi:hypothetical protein